MTKSKLLCVGDDVGFRNLGRSLLRTFRYDVSLAESGIRAVNLLNVWHPDVAIVDSHMVGMGGAELAWKIKRLAPHVPVILVSDCQSIVEEAPLFLDAASDKCAPIAQLIVQIEALAPFSARSL